MVTVASLFADNVASDPAQPMLTWYSPDERTELSGATLANWVSKTANLLVDGLGLGPGDTASVNLPPHWQTSSIMLACWTAGLAISHRGGDGDVSFGLPGTGCDYVVGLHPMALPATDLSGDQRDWVLEARAHGDRYAGPPPDADAPALVGLPQPVSHADLAALALARAAELGVVVGAERMRVLIDVGAHPRPLDWLLAPIAGGASLVLCQGVDDLAKIAATERATIIA
jgi:uncharacterized protein (TIGR03089 family)